MRQERVAPKAAMLIESMRDLGYSLQTALADIIDNSITAGATKVQLFANTDVSDPSIALVDDGKGMTEGELLDAMRPGSRNPLTERGGADLGRFGLGLKTASFSQCRRLTVVSRKNGQTSCARWDLDEVAAADDWLVDLPDSVDNIPCIHHLGSTGTLVLWQKLDRLLDRGGIDNSVQLARQIDEASNHLELVFHRFLAGERGLKKVTLSINGRLLEPFDPFHTDHPATQLDPAESVLVGGQKISINTYTLPHHKKVTAAEWDRYAGRDGYVKNQGFYVYRGKRLIIHGTWFGLARQTELTKLARVRIDMPNSLDADWKIDVKKASAHPPAPVRERLRRIIETIGGTSKRVYTTRGKQLATDDRLPVWVRIQDKGAITYNLNSSHPVFTNFSSRLSPEMQDEFKRALELASASMPIDALFADTSGSPEKVSGSTLSSGALMSIVETTYNTLLSSGICADDITNMLSMTEPFRSNWEATAAKLKDLINGAVL